MNYTRTKPILEMGLNPEGFDVDSVDYDEDAMDYCLLKQWVVVRKKRWREWVAAEMALYTHCVRLMFTTKAGRIALLEAPDTEPVPECELEAPVQKRRRNWDIEALAIFYQSVEDGRPLRKKEIAERLGCNEKSLAPRRCPKFSKAFNAHRAKEWHRGFKDGHGNLEAEE